MGRGRPQLGRTRPSLGPSHAHIVSRVACLGAHVAHSVSSAVRRISVRSHVAVAAEHVCSSPAPSRQMGAQVSCRETCRDAANDAELDEVQQEVPSLGVCEVGHGLMERQMDSSCDGPLVGNSKEYIKSGDSAGTYLWEGGRRRRENTLRSLN